MRTGDPGVSRRVRLVGSPSPDVTRDEAVAIADEVFGLRARGHDLGSQQDRNVRLDSADGRYVLKIANADWDANELLAQNAVLGHLSRAGCPVEVPSVRPARDGSEMVEVDVRGRRHRVRLLGYLDGTPLTGAAYLAPSVRAELADLAARVNGALADLDHPGLDRSLQWDLRFAGEVIHALAPHVADAARRDRVLATAGEALDAVARVEESLSRQVIHGDLTDDNVVARRGPDGRLHPHGVIDFGDVTRSWRVGELAVTLTCLLHHDLAEPLDVLDAVAAWHRQTALTESETTALWPLVVLRAATLVVNGWHQAALDPRNAYVGDALDREWRMFARACEVPLPVAEEAVRHRLGLPPGRRALAARAALAAAVPLLPDGIADAVEVLDLSVTNPRLTGGSWLGPGFEEQALAAHPVAATRHGEFRLSRTEPNARTPPLALALGSTMRLPPGLALGPRPDLPGVQIAVEGRGGLWRVSACVPGLVPPPFVTARSGPAWLRLCPDPSPLLGFDVLAAPEPDPDALLARRDSSFATLQGHYYAAPPRIERGWRHHLVDTTARSYLDMVNNVTVLGHAHPAFVRAVSDQWQLLNTNSRFHYAAVAEFARRLAALAPAGLDTVFLVNSGSEAVDVALRLAFAHTGRRDVLALAEAYHGITYASDAVTTSVADNPLAPGTRPGWVHTALAPNAYRGLHRGPDAARRYAEDVEAVLDRAAAAGTPVAAFIAEALSGNAGGVELPAGYLRRVYDAVRARGGLCIADEVQVGYGRTGDHFWAFAHEGVVPDVITVAKAMGNGQPVGAVITRMDIAASLAAQGSFFSSAGGSPVSARAGLAVLDAIRDEGLQENAAATGAHLRARLLALMDTHPLIGAVHGRGLYLGVELVLDRATREPATAVAAAICDRMLELGVVVQPTGDRSNVLKVKPPMCLDRAAADTFADRLDEVLRRGW